MSMFPFFRTRDGKGTTDVVVLGASGGTDEGSATAESASTAHQLQLGSPLQKAGLPIAFRHPFMLGN